MAPQGKLVKVGREAFDILEEYLGKKKKPPSCSYRPVKMTQSKKNEAVTDSYQAAKAYGGALVVAYRSQPEVARWAF